MAGKIRVLVVDDSALVRDILTKGLAMDPGLDIVGSASDPYVARDMIMKLDPDVMTLDVEMPRMDGVEFLRKLMPQRPIPVVMVSALTEKGKKITFEALEAGAVDFVTKPSVDVMRGLNAMLMELRTKVKIASTANVSHFKSARQSLNSPPPASRSLALAETTDKVIVIGASAGGTEAIREVLTRFPSTAPGVVITQHMPPGFTKLFAERLNSLCSIEVKEAANGDRVMPGRALIAPGGSHMRIVRSGGIYKVECAPGDPICGHCPSVEALMLSAAKYVGSNAIGVILTGMGQDGAGGLKAMRDAGARTMAQNEATCVVFGMPKVAWEKGGVERLVPLYDIGDAVLSLLKFN